MATQQETSHVFVYGTLKVGQPNHKILLDPANGQAQLVSRALTTNSYPLVIASKYNIPFLLNLPGVGHRIEGEVYRVDGQMLRFLDDFEGVGEGYYDRIEIPVELLHSKGEQDPLYLNASTESPFADSFTASAYFLREFKEKLLELPFLQNYDSYGSHGLPYEERFDRSAKEEADSAIPEVKVPNKT